jgi:cyanophycin synthetase
VPYLPLPGGVFQLGLGSRARRINRSTTDRDSALGAAWTQNKVLTAQLLCQAGLPGPTHLRVQSAAQAKQAADRIGYPVVVKPVDRERGEGVNVDVPAEALEATFTAAHQCSPSKQVIIEKQVAGVCHRLFIVAGKLLYAVRRLPMGVYADGHTPIHALVAAECKAQHSLAPWKRSGIQALDELALHILRRQGWGPDSVPEKGRFVALRRIETTAWGGVDEDVSDTLHPDNVKIAIAAARLFGLDVAGVDIISQDIKKPWHTNGAIINEVNYAPLLGGGAISRARIPAFLTALLEGDGRIPIHAHVGGTKALEAAKEQWKRLLANGTRAVFVSADHVLLPSGEPHTLLITGLYARCRALALSPDVEALVLVIHTDEFTQTGLPFPNLTQLHESAR